MVLVADEMYIDGQPIFLLEEDITVDRLPDGNSAEVPLDKIRLYLLSREHPTGRAKAAFFRSLGFRAEASEELQTALLRLALEGKLTASAETRFGWKYVVEGHIEGPSGVSAIIRSVWITESGSNRPRFVTAYPAPAEKA